MAKKSTAPNLEELFMQSDSEFKTAIKKLEGKSRDAHEKRKDESKVINSVLFPLIRTLGYDPFNDEEVIPQFVADIGTRQGEKVDFAIAINDEPAMFLEAKNATEFLGDIAHRNQLFRYFTTTDVRIAILTNGVEAWFYSDFNKPNVMDDEPFFKFNFQNASDDDINFLELFCKSEFSIEKIINKVEKIKQFEEVNIYIQNHIIEANDEFVNFIRENSGIASIKNIENQHLKSLIKSAFYELSQKDKQEIISQTNNPQSATEPSTNIKSINPHAIRRAKYRNQEPTKTIFETYDARIKGIASDIHGEEHLHSISYSVDQVVFASIELKSKSIQINLVLKNGLADLNGDAGGFVPRPDRHKNGLGNFCRKNVTVIEGEEFEKIIEKIKCAYERIRSQIIC